MFLEKDNLSFIDFFLTSIKQLSNIVTKYHDNIKIFIINLFIYDVYKKHLLNLLNDYIVHSQF